MKDRNPKSILLLAANPRQSLSLRLQEEEREIKERLRLSGYGKTPIFSIGATRPRDIQQAMLDFKPQIVHFSGHGAGQDGLVFEDATGRDKAVSSEALQNLFRLFSNQVECVVLNACYSEVQADAIAQHVNYVIGMRRAISDRAAIEFSIGFYSALGAGESIEFAYHLGCNAVELEGIPEYLTPVLLKKAQLPKELQKSRIREWTITLNASFDEISETDARKIINHLQHLTGDASLKLNEIERGSIILKLESTEEAYKVIEALYKEGKLTELLGLPIKHVGYEASNTKSSHSFNNIVNVFFSYCHKDEDLRNELANHLRILERNGVISSWCDRQIIPGEEWEDQIDERMNSARIVLLCVSSDFIASNYCWNIEVKRAMERHEAGEACVVPVILRPVNWRKSPFGKLQALPQNAKPVTTWSNRDEAFLSIAQGIESVVSTFTLNK